MKKPLQLAEQFKTSLTEYQKIVGMVAFEHHLDKTKFETEVLRHLIEHFLTQVEALEPAAA